MKIGMELLRLLCTFTAYVRQASLMQSNLFTVHFERNQLTFPTAHHKIILGRYRGILNRIRNKVKQTAGEMKTVYN